AFLVFILGLLLASCSTLRTDFVRVPSQSLPPRADTASTRYVQAEVDAHGGQSGFRLLVGNQNALMSRIVMIDHARHSIDLQYYIYFNDATGRLVAQRLLAAADRGVRVRVLLDDIDIVKEDALLDALDAHPRIEVRLFNPFRFRERSMLAKAGQFLIEGARLNRRMHNKSFTVDGMQSIIGGRNIGDAYYDVGDDVFFRDLDVLAIGPVVGEIAAAFDRYWNSDAAFPVRAYSGEKADHGDLASQRAALARDARAFSESDYAQALSQELPRGPSAEREGPWFWGDAAVVVDDPDKVDPGEDRSAAHIDRSLRRVLDAARNDVVIVSPYLIPGKDGEALLVAIAARGVRIRALTNSLAATDEAAVHSGYARYRIPLLEAGIELYEFRPVSAGANTPNAHGTSSGVSLHSKALVVDGRRVFIGSMNFDPRSRHLNTELGVIVDSPALGAAITDYFERASGPANAWQAVYEPRPGGRSKRPTLQWIERDGTRETHRYDNEPQATLWKRTQVRIARMLPIEGLL
ncbi:MAG TPA: phospholipase D family protein, partial [Dokdonella sp.]